MPENITIVPVSNWLADQVSRSFLKNFPCKVIHNGIDTEVFKPYNQTEMKQKFNFKKRKILLGVASVWSRRKGLDDFLKLSAMLSADCQIILVGLSDKQKKELPPNIYGISKTESMVELAQLYSAADVVLNLSREETFGLTTVEGFACGTPCVAYDKTATPELFVPDTGFVIPAGNIDALCRAVLEITEKGKNFYSDICRNHALAHFRMQDRFGEYIELYKQLINN